MYINAEWHANIPLNGKTVSRESSTFPHELTAVDGQMGTDGYKRLWKIWSNNEYNLYQNLYSPGNYTYEAQFDKEYNLTFVANSTMYINGNPRTSSWIEYVREQSSNSVYAINYSQIGLSEVNHIPAQLLPLAILHIQQYIPGNQTMVTALYLLTIHKKGNPFN